MRGVARVGAALLRSGGVRSAAGRGIDLVTQIGDVASEAVRSRRDPVMVAHRRRVAARRRLIAWSVAVLVLAAIGTTLLLGVIGGDRSAASIGTLVLVLGLLVYGLLGAASGGIDLVTRTRVVRRLPPPQPRRQPVASSVRPQIQRLDGYSDALREVVGMIGVSAADQTMRELRDQTLTAADDAERRLRAQAAELTAISRAGGPRGAVAATRRRLQGEIAAGVDEYGRLVAAASGAASASAALASHGGAVGGVAEVTDRLNAITAGMREIIGAGPAGA